MERKNLFIVLKALIHFSEYANEKDLIDETIVEVSKLLEQFVKG